MRLKSYLSMLFAVLLLCNFSFAAEKAEVKVIRLESFTGKLSVVSGTGKEQSVNEKMRIFDGYTVITSSDSNAYLSLDNTKSVKLDKNTKINVLKKDKINEIQVVSGSIFFSVTEKLKDDETLKVTTPTMSMGIRGTTGMVSVNKKGSRGQLYSGKVIVTDTLGIQEEVSAGEEVKSTAVKEEGSSEEPQNLEVVKISITGEDIPSFTLNEINNNEEVKAQIEEEKVFEVEKFVEAEVVNKEKEEETIKEEQKVIEEIKIEAETQKVENEIEVTEEVIETPVEEVILKKITKEYNNLNTQKLDNSQGKVYVFEVDPETGIAEFKEEIDFSGNLEVNKQGSSVNILENGENKESISTDGGAVYKVVE